MAGSGAAYDAVFEESGAIGVRSIDDLMNVAALCAAGRVPRSGGAALITDSGGLRELAVDLAAETNAGLALLSEATVQSLRAILPAKLEPSNPLDCASDITEDFSKSFSDAFDVLSSADEVAMIGLEADLRDDYVYEDRLLDLALSLADRTDKPIFFYASFGRANNLRLGQMLAERGIPCINGIGEVLNAVSKLQAWSDARSRQGQAAPAVEDRNVGPWRLYFAGGGQIGEHSALSLLASFGVPVVNHEEHARFDEVIDAAGRLGYPVALKTAAGGIAHKSDRGGVWLDLKDRNALAGAYAALAATPGKRDGVPDVSLNVGEEPKKNG